jgi:O-methyltransferase involved in polyketide biosynthesis
MAKVAVELDRVPETLLWTLYHRGVEARRPDAVLEDPLAVELVDRLDFPFRERFGAGERFSQWQALRARCFDGAVRRFLADHHEGTVVALGEGLETQFWRVDNGSVRWLTVDLPEVVELRQLLLPSEPRSRTIASSALDPGWLDDVDGAAGVLVTAQGLLMYFSREEVHWLIAACARRFRGQAMAFDVVPRWLMARSQSGQLKTDAGYEPPPWSWGFDRDEERLLRRLPGVAKLERLRLPRGRGAAHGLVLPLVARLPVLRGLVLTVHQARFG